MVSGDDGCMVQVVSGNTTLQRAKVNAKVSLHLHTPTQAEMAQVGMSHSCIQWSRRVKGHNGEASDLLRGSGQVTCPPPPHPDFL